MSFAVFLRKLKEVHLSYNGRPPVQKKETLIRLPIFQFYIFWHKYILYCVWQASIYLTRSHSLPASSPERLVGMNGEWSGTKGDKTGQPCKPSSLEEGPRAPTLWVLCTSRILSVAFFCDSLFTGMSVFHSDGPPGFFIAAFPKATLGTMSTPF